MEEVWGLGSGPVFVGCSRFEWWDPGDFGLLLSSVRFGILQFFRGAYRVLAFTGGFGVSGCRC